MIPSGTALKECKSVSLHDHTTQIKTFIRSFAKEYKKIDIVRPYAKPGPIVTATVHPHMRRSLLNQGVVS